MGKTYHSKAVLHSSHSSQSSHSSHAVKPQGKQAAVVKNNKVRVKDAKSSDKNNKNENENKPYKAPKSWLGKLFG
jgi:hypothetical protein